MRINCVINGCKKELVAEPHELLIDVLRREGYLGVKRGCNSGDCGSCTIIMNNKTYNSCQLFAAKAKDSEILTIEGLGTLEEPHVIQKSYVETGGIQCGYCIPGMILSTKYLLDKTKNNPTQQEIKKELAGNLCRCTGYVKQIEAVEKAAAALRAQEGK